MRVAVFASGNGSNFQAIAEAFQNHPEIEIVFVFSDKPDSFVLQRAEKFHLPTLCLEPKQFENKQAFEEKILEHLQAQQVDWIILAGYMRLIGMTLLQPYEHKIINIHPSLLPAYPGKDSILKAYQAGEMETGVTIHYVDAGMDSGPIIVQEKLKINQQESLEDLEDRIHQLEHRIYPKTIIKVMEENQNDKKSTT